MFLGQFTHIPYGIRYLGIHQGESYNGICARADYLCVLIYKYQDTPHKRSLCDLTNNGAGKHRVARGIQTSLNTKPMPKAKCQYGGLTILNTLPSTTLNPNDSLSTFGGQSTKNEHQLNKNIPQLQQQPSCRLGDNCSLYTKIQLLWLNCTCVMMIVTSTSCRASHCRPMMGSFSGALLVNPVPSKTFYRASG